MYSSQVVKTTVGFHYIQVKWLKPPLDFIIKGYVAVRDDRDSSTEFIEDGMQYLRCHDGTEHDSMIARSVDKESR